LTSRPIAAVANKVSSTKAAKQEALDRYFNDLRMKVNPAGMRTQDEPGFNKKLQDWISNGVANRGEIGKGGLTKQEHLLKYQEIIKRC
jgi:hypothetical protein